MKKIAIVGGGISGLTSGIYALEQGYDVSIYEKHTIVGGECTGWRRKGVYVDGCIHWLMNSKEGSNFYDMWKKIGFIGDGVNLIHYETFADLDIDGVKVKFYCNPDRLEKELISHFPEDEREIKKITSYLRRLPNVEVPTALPFSMYNLFDFLKMGAEYFKYAIMLLRLNAVRVREYANRFKNPTLQKMMRSLMRDENNMLSLLFTIAGCAVKGCGYPEGGSLNAAMRARDIFLSKGGKIFTGQEVDKIEVENGTTKGIILADGSKVLADYVISATDIYQTFGRLVDAKYMPRVFKKRIANPSKYVTASCVMVYLKKKREPILPRREVFSCEPFDFYGSSLDQMNMLDYAFDKTLNEDYSVISCLIDCPYETYLNIKKLNKEEYYASKQKLGEDIKLRLEKKYGIPLEVVDVTTPLTNERYLNATFGSYMAFTNSAKTGSVMADNRVKGIKGLILGGQWLQSPGGLPVALMSGRQAVQRICALDGKFYKFR